MKNIFIGIFAIVFLLNSCGEMGKKEEINNYVLIKNSNPVINFNIWFKTGSAFDSDGKEGVANLTAQMLTQASTKNNSFAEINEKLYPLAAGYGSKVDKEMIVIRGRTHKDNIDDFYPLFIDAIVTPKFATEDFERIRSNTLNNVQNTLRFSSDEELGKATLYEMIFEGTPYQHLTSGYITSLESMKLWDVKEFYKDHFNNENFVIGLSGDFPDSLLSKLKDDLTTGLTPKVVDDSLAIEPKAIEGLNFRLIEKKTDATAISFGFPINLTRANDDYYALDLFRSWFGEHRNNSSHLYQVIREARGMNYGDYAYIEAFLNGGSLRMPDPNNPRSSQIFQVWIRPVQHIHRHFALRAALRELKLVVDNGLTQEQFETTKKFLDKYCLHYAASDYVRLGYQIDSRFYGVNDKGNFINYYRDKINSLTLEQVNSAIKKYIQYDNIAFGIITQDAESFKTDIVSNTPSPIEYGSEKPEYIYEEDKEITNFIINAKEENITIIPIEDMFVK